MREAEEVEGLRLPFSALLPVPGRERPELQKARLVGMQFELELLESLRERVRIPHLLASGGSVESAGRTRGYIEEGHARAIGGRAAHAGVRERVRQPQEAGSADFRFPGSLRLREAIHRHANLSDEVEFEGIASLAESAHEKVAEAFGIKEPRTVIGAGGDKMNVVVLVVAKQARHDLILSAVPQTRQSAPRLRHPPVEAESGRLDASTTRPWHAVSKVYTPFQEGDVLFAKITPCMKNGKFALAIGLVGGRESPRQSTRTRRSRESPDLRTSSQNYGD